MKTLFALFLLSVAGLSHAESCSFNIVDRYGRETDTITRVAYSRDAACGEAEHACRIAVVNSRQYDATCREVRRSAPRPTLSQCTTDLIDFRGIAVRSFSGSGRTEGEACRQSEEFCRSELRRGDSRGRQCVTRGRGGNRPDQPRPPRLILETCRVNRVDPAGFLVETHIGTASGVAGTDVKGAACREANNICSGQLRGRQSCRVER